MISSKDLVALEPTHASPILKDDLTLIDEFQLKYFEFRRVGFKESDTSQYLVQRRLREEFPVYLLFKMKNLEVLRLDDTLNWCSDLLTRLIEQNINVKKDFLVDADVSVGWTRDDPVGTVLDKEIFVQFRENTLEKNPGCNLSDLIFVVASAAEARKFSALDLEFTFVEYSNPQAEVYANKFSLKNPDFRKELGLQY